MRSAYIDDDDGCGDADVEVNEGDDDNKTSVDVDEATAAEAGITSRAERTSGNDVSKQTTSCMTTKRLEMREI